MQWSVPQFLPQFKNYLDFPNKGKRLISIEIGRS